jgi:CRP-like cAMP-binding protein
MAKRTGVSPRVVKSPIDGDGNSVANNILLGLSPEERSQVLPRLEFVRLMLHQVLHEAGETIKSGYFVNSGMMSILAVQPTGKRWK